MILRPVVVLAAALAAAQSQPTFRSRVDLIRLDVSVMTSDGRPVQDLTASDFVVRVDGKPREVSFARFYGPEEDRGPAPLQPLTERTASFGSNVGTAARGRIVVFVLDIDGMRPGYEKNAFDAAGTLVDSLGPSDWAGLVVLTGKNVELTRDHARVRDTLAHLHGAWSHNVALEHAVSVEEADAIQAMNRQVTSEVIERECAVSYNPASSLSGCPAHIVKVEVPQILTEADRRIQSVLHALSDVNERLQPIDMPRTIVLLSSGLAMRREHHGLLKELQERSAKSGTSMHVIEIEEPESDATDQTKPGAGRLSRDDRKAGLSAVAGATNGTYRYAVSRATGVFDRLRTEVVHSYQLGVASVPADSDGKMHTIAVEVRRPGVSVRSRRDLIVSSAPAKPRSAVDALSLPSGLAEIPMSVAAYVTQGDDAATLKVILLVEAFGGAAQSAPLSYALTIANDDRRAFETSDKMAPQQTGARAVLATQLPAGRYWIRAAIVDADGKAGSVDLPLSAELHPAGPLKTSDLLAGTADDRFAPSSYIGADKPVVAMIELYAIDPSQFKDVSVELEMTAAGSDAVVAHAPASIGMTPAQGRRVADGRLDASSLPAGNYVIRAVVKKNGERIGTVERAIVRRGKNPEGLPTPYGTRGGDGSAIRSMAYIPRP